MRLRAYLRRTVEMRVQARVRRTAEMRVRAYVVQRLTRPLFLFDRKGIYGSSVSRRLFVARDR
jgi:hypothetical protein